MLPDCAHTNGFRCHVADRGGHFAICNDCGLWCWLDRDGKVAQYPPKDAVHSLETHGANGATTDAGTSPQSDRGV